MNAITCIAIDDEPLALEVIQRFSSKVPALNLLKCFLNPIEAADFLQYRQVDILFLDIQMPDLSGLQFLQSIPQKPLIIFTTAYSQYAIDSYELDAVDYLLKPILFDRFLKAVHKAQKLLLNEKAEGEFPVKKAYLFIKSDTRFFKVNYEDILFIEGMRDYIAVHIKGKKILTLMSMTKMLAKLPPRNFMRVHKSYIIGLKHIMMVQNNRILIGEREIPISNSYKESFLKFMEGMGQ